MDSEQQELCDLIARCALKDQQSLKRLYDKTCAYLNAVAYRILKSDELANETLQEAFIQIWENASSYRSNKAKPLTWMTSILRYRALDRLDKEQRYQRTFHDVELSEHHHAVDLHTPESLLASYQTGNQLKSCLSALNNKIQDCIRLAYLYGYSRDEIAERLDTNVNTVKSWLKRGSERLKQCLETKIAIQL